MIDTFDYQDIDRDVSNVVSIWSRLSTSNKNYLTRWVKRGHVLGLLDAEAAPSMDGRGNVQVLVWVREAADAAYRLHPNGTGWTVVDNLRGHELSRHPSFEAALEAIRPVFSFNAVQPRKRAGRLGHRSTPASAALGEQPAVLRV